ncbi:ribosomal protein L21 [Artemisia annua]|uniref:Ribosomal protein L21 n=1 Tax=Artemisia annua TaxID=35608 RepID=A0A2U1PNW5_ARTAN|nr:ribosomal protein L21 [Artemisia annua]
MAMSICCTSSSMTPIFTHKNTPSTSTTTLSKLPLCQSHVVSRTCFLKSAKSSTTTIVPLKVSSTETPSAVDVPEEVPEAVEFEAADGTNDGQEEAKGEEVFAVVMIGGRQYIVFPGRFLYTQRLKGAAVDDKVSIKHNFLSILPLHFIYFELILYSSFSTVVSVGSLWSSVSHRNWYL